MGTGTDAGIEGRILKSLSPRAGDGSVDIHWVRNGLIIVFRSRSLDADRETDVAMLKSVKEHYHLYCKRSSGRWLPYKKEDGDVVIGTLGECLDEIKKDPQGIFWK